MKTIIETVGTSGIVGFFLVNGIGVAGACFFWIKTKEWVLVVLMLLIALLFSLLNLAGQIEYKREEEKNAKIDLILERFSEEKRSETFFQKWNER